MNSVVEPIVVDLAHANGGHQFLAQHPSQHRRGMKRVSRGNGPEVRRRTVAFAESDEFPGGTRSRSGRILLEPGVRASFCLRLQVCVSGSQCGIPGLVPQPRHIGNGKVKMGFGIVGRRSCGGKH